MIPRNLEEVKTLQRTSDKKIKILPAKLVTTKKKKARKPVKNKARVVSANPTEFFDKTKATNSSTTTRGRHKASRS